MSETILGQKITGECSRDAVHIAVAPVVAAHALSPGFKVGLDEQGRADTGVTPYIGIIDPFLTEPVQAGDKVWLCLFPRTITSLNHSWKHPAFEKGDATEWIRKFAGHWGYTFDAFMAGAKTYLEEGEEMDDGWKQLDIEDDEWALFWVHFKTLTGLDIGDGEKEFVKCCA